MKQLTAALIILSALSAFGQRPEPFYSREWTTQPEWDVMPYLPGFDRFRYYMTVDEVKKIIQEDGYVAKGKEYIETVRDLYNFTDVRQEFIFYLQGVNIYYQLSFTTNINGIRKTAPYTLTHLRQRDSKNYMVITCEAGDGKKYPKWEHKFIFYNLKKKVYKLFAIVATYRNEQSLGQFDWIHPHAFEYYMDQIRDRYGYPDNQKWISVDAYAGKEIKTYQYHHKKPAGRGTYDIVSQINVSYIRFAGRIANFQVTYITPDYLKEDLFKIELQEYDDPIEPGKEIVF